MLVPPIVDDEEEEADNQDSIPRPAPSRKTKQQRAKQANLKAEVRFRCFSSALMQWLTQYVHVRPKRSQNAHFGNGY